MSDRVFPLIDGASFLRAVPGKRLTIAGSTLRPQITAEKAEIARQLAEKLLPLLAKGAVKPMIF